MDSVNVVRSAGVVSGAVLLSRISGLIREMVMVRLFGAGAAYDAFLVVFRSGSARLFIQPGYRLRTADLLLTNFHLPESTLFVLVSALLGVDFAQEAYREAVRERYRFFSYGDAMLILNARR